jgi:hypothetical protein
MGNSVVAAIGDSTRAKAVNVVRANLIIILSLFLATGHHPVNGIGPAPACPSAMARTFFCTMTGFESIHNLARLNR